MINFFKKFISTKFYSWILFKRDDGKDLGHVIEFKTELQIIL